MVWLHRHCDLRLLEAPHFDSDAKLTTDIRTTVWYENSYIESVAVAIREGEEIFEASSFGDYSLGGISNGGLRSEHVPVRKRKTIVSAGLGNVQGKSLLCKWLLLS